MFVQAFYFLQACIITVLVGLIVRYLQSPTFCVSISGTPVVEDSNVIILLLKIFHLKKSRSPILRRMGLSNYGPRPRLTCIHSCSLI